ncbi:hypothetical protein ElyMa_003966400 [Elysia marginata]|uniref:Uncharacterized protein n=1 Tax=Elysia marginata TaxID=1093978 RepID=A0AAV4FX99_9GAST|nr:hypothetical protein ElyMa_003966400 [Elysia marginata]
MKLIDSAKAIGAANRLRWNNKLSGIFKNYVKPSRMGKNEMLDRVLAGKMRVTDVCCYPLIINPTMSNNNSCKKYVLYHKFYCVLPTFTQQQQQQQQRRVAEIESAEQSVLVEYTTWLTAGRARELDHTMLDAIAKADRQIPFFDTVLTWNNYFLTNKFEYAGYVIATSDGGVETVHLVYHRTPKPSQGLVIDRFLFCIASSQHDTTTQVSLSDRWEGELAGTVQFGHTGNTQLFWSVPTDKSLYALVSTPLIGDRKLGGHHMKG